MRALTMCFGPNGIGFHDTENQLVGMDAHEMHHRNCPAHPKFPAHRYGGGTAYCASCYQFVEARDCCCYAQFATFHKSPLRYLYAFLMVWASYLVALSGLSSPRWLSRLRYYAAPPTLYSAIHPQPAQCIGVAPCLCPELGGRKPAALQDSSQGCAQ